MQQKIRIRALIILKIVDNKKFIQLNYSKKFWNLTSNE